MHLTCSAKFALHLSRRRTLLSFQSVEELQQCHKVLHAEVRPAGRHDDERIHANHVCPHRRQRAQAAFPVVEEHPVLVPGVAVAQQFELLAMQWVERVSDAKRSLLINHTGCS